MGLLNGGMRDEHILDLGRHHLFAAATVGLLPPTDEGQVAIRVKTAEIAAPQPTVGG